MLFDGAQGAPSASRGAPAARRSRRQRRRLWLRATQPQGEPCRRDVQNDRYPRRAADAQVLQSARNLPPSLPRRLLQRLRRRGRLPPLPLAAHLAPFHCSRFDTATPRRRDTSLPSPPQGCRGEKRLPRFGRSQTKRAWLHLHRPKSTPDRRQRGCSAARRRLRR